LWIAIDTGSDVAFFSYRRSLLFQQIAFHVCTASTSISFCDKLEFQHLVAVFQEVQARNVDSSNFLCDSGIYWEEKVLVIYLLHFDSN
jgi:hypothetical protein